MQVTNDSELHGKLSFLDPLAEMRPFTNERQPFCQPSDKRRESATSDSFLVESLLSLLTCIDWNSLQFGGILQDCPMRCGAVVC